MNKQIYILLILITACCLSATAVNRWKINADGGITWTINGNLPHEDHIEMSGLKVSTVLYYGVNNNGAFTLNRHMVWPMLRTIPNNTHASLMRNFGGDVTEMINVNGRTLQGEKVTDITLNGTMIVNSTFNFSREGKVKLTRIIFPSTTKPSLYEKYILKNTGKDPINVEIPFTRSVINTDPEKGVDGSYNVIAVISGRKAKLLKSDEEITFSASYTGYKNGENEITPDIDKELLERQALVTELWGKLVLESPDKTINKMFAFAKIRAAESIYDTKNGLMHGPGGESYYAAIWANDQAEYINPFFPYLGYDIGNRSALNAYMLFARFISPEYKPIPSSIIAEGTDIWNGAGDRGDGAMIAYGASRYALARGNKAEAEKLWPLIEWTLEYCKRQLNKSGVVASDTDELEGRFPAGKANLCTSSLYYDALCSAVFLGKNLGKSASQLADYTKRAEAIKKNIDKYFGSTVEGFNTYKYYEDNNVLRAWICIPLVMGIYNRKEATINALFSPQLWTENGLLSQAGSETFWDRSTLYALRGVFACGETEKAIDYLRYYTNRRLLGEHVPYAIEAWPEGGQRHLSAESGLYCRIITEGMFGIRPTGLHAFTFTPRLPKNWDHMSLNKIGAFGHVFNISVKRSNNKNKLKVTVNSEGKTICDKKIKEGEALNIKF